MQSSSNPFVFVVGCPRSGTTLLQRMLDSHPELAVSNDTHFIPRVLKDELNPRMTSDLVENVLNYKRFPRLGLSTDIVLEVAAKSFDFRGFVTGLYDEFARSHEKKFGGEKTPDYVKHLSLLHALFPWSRFVHIIRDGRDVALSMLEWACKKKNGPAKFRLWEDQPLAVCALFWRWQVTRGLRDGSLLGPDLYCEVRYEQLVSNPPESLRRIARFLDLSYSERMANYYEGKTRYEKNLSAKSAWLPPTAGLRDWHANMSGRDVELFEAIAGDLLDILRYPRMYSRISSQISDAAERFRCLFEAEIQKRVEAAIDLSV